MIIYEHKAKSDQVTQWGKVTCIRTSDSQLFVVVGICKSVLCFMSEMPDRLRFVSKCVYYTSDLITVFVYSTINKGLIISSQNWFLMKWVYF